MAKITNDVVRLTTFASFRRDSALVAILKWMFVLILLIAVAGGGAAYWLFARSDEVLRQTVLKQLKDVAPELRFEITRANFGMFGAKVWIYGMSVFFPGDERDRPSMEIPETVATLESSQLSDLEAVVIQKLYLIEPKLRLVRSADGNWNLPKIAFRPTPGTPMPDLEIKNASVLVEFQMPDKTTRKLPFKKFNVSAHPADSRRLSILVATMFEPAGRAKLQPFGPLTLDIEVALDGSKWALSSYNSWKVPIDSAVIQLACDLSPQITEHVQKLGQLLEAAKIPRLDAPVKFVSQSSQKTALPEFGLECLCDLNFRVKKDTDDQPLQFQAKADFSKGRVDNDVLPFPLNDLEGTVYVDNRQISVKDLRASNGLAKILLGGEVIPSTPIKATMKFRGIELTDDLKARLPEPLRKIVQSLNLTGFLDADATVTQDGGKWPMEAELSLSKGTVTHERFPVTVRDIEGKLHLHQGVVEFDATGKYSGQLVKAHGTIENPGPEHQAQIVIKSENLPLEDEAVAACPPPIRASIEALRLKGRQDVMMRINRPPGLNQKYVPELNLHLYNGSLSFKQFRYNVEQLDGFVRWKGEVVEFINLKGVHDGAAIAGAGTFVRPPGQRGRLDLNISANDAAFDRSLADALPPNLQKVWNQFQPKGDFDVIANVNWVPGTPCVISLPKLVVRDGEVTMRCFPWALSNLTGEFEFNTNRDEPGKLLMKTVRAEHDDTVLVVNGTGWFPNGSRWRLDFDRMIVENLRPSGTFRNALPAGMRKIVDALRPEGTFTLDGPVLFYELPTNEQSIGAAWKLECILSKCAMTLGTRIEDIHGAVNLNGTWNGTEMALDGDLDINSLRIFRNQASGRSYQITKVLGPFSLRDGQLIAGNELAIPPRESNSPDPEKRIRGTAIRGTVFLDAAVTLSEEPTYKAFIELQNGRLEEYARQYLRGQSNLAGVMNGWMNLRGRGSGIDKIGGDGKLVIAPASLYELPLFAQIFNVLQLQGLDKTAFEQAELIFKVANERFNFSSIEMQGDSVKMGGYGFVRFDGAMELNFGLKLRQLIPNPFRGIMAVNVSGNIGDPKVRYGPQIDLDDWVKQFLSPIGRMPARPIYPPARSTQSTESSLR